MYFCDYNICKMEIQKLTTDEIKFITGEYKKSTNFYFGAMGVVVLFSIIALFLPASLFGRKARRAGIEENIFSSVGASTSILYVVMAIVLFGVLFYLVLNIRGLKKDIVHQEKIIVKAKVSQIENLPANIVKDMEGGKDTILHFANDGHSVKKLYFNKNKRPELIGAKYVCVERTKFGKIDLRYNITE
jgi:hypothetical protein